MRLRQRGGADDGCRVLGDIRSLDRLGWRIKNVVTEGAYSQFELDYGTDVVGMADRFLFLRVVLKEIAKRHGRSSPLCRSRPLATGDPARTSTTITR